MLGKRARPPVRRSPAPEPIIPAERGGFSDVATSPRSPTKWKNHESEGVGLGIVAALEKKSGEIPARFVVGSLNLGRSDPIPVGLGKNPARFAGGSEMVCSESYTCVISHGVKSSVTRVYCGEKEGKDSKRNEQFGNFGVFWASPPTYTEEISSFPTSDFLSCCYLCRKKLHGKDIYMYRGEKAFCSSECRYRQIVNDERKEKCRSEAPKSSDISVSSYSENRLFCVVAA